MPAKFALAISVQEPKPKRTVQVEGARVTIGRRSDADIHLDDPDVAPEHAVIELNGENALTLVDLGSEAGTFVDGTRITRKALAPGDRVVVGASTLELVSAGPVLDAGSGSYRDAPKAVSDVPAPVSEPRPPERPTLASVVLRWWSTLPLAGVAGVYFVRYGVSIPHSATDKSLSLAWPPSQLAHLSIVVSLCLLTGDAISRRADGARTALGRLLLVLAALVAFPVLIQLAFALLSVGAVVYGIISVAIVAVTIVVAIARWIFRGK